MANILLLTYFAFSSIEASWARTIEFTFVANTTNAAVETWIWITYTYNNGTNEKLYIIRLDCIIMLNNIKKMNQFKLLLRSQIIPL